MVIRLRERKHFKVYYAPALMAVYRAKDFVARMLRRDLFAVANLHANISILFAFANLVSSLEL